MCTSECKNCNSKKDTSRLLQNVTVRKDGTILNNCGEEIGHLDVGFCSHEIQLDRSTEALAETCKGLVSIVDGLQKEIAAKQAQIDRLMLEYCPEEMSLEQLKNWTMHQKSDSSARVEDDVLAEQKTEGAKTLKAVMQLSEAVAEIKNMFISNDSPSEQKESTTDHLENETHVETANITNQELVNLFKDTKVIRASVISERIIGITFDKDVHDVVSSLDKIMTFFQKRMSKETK